MAESIPIMVGGGGGGSGGVYVLGVIACYANGIVDTLHNPEILIFARI